MIIKQDSFNLYTTTTSHHARALRVKGRHYVE